MWKALLTLIEVSFCCMKSWPSPREVLGRRLLVSSSTASPQLLMANILLIAAAIICFLLTRGDPSAIFSITTVTLLPADHLQCSAHLPHGSRVCPTEGLTSPHRGFARYNPPSATFASSSVWEDLISILKSIGFPIIFQCLLSSSLHSKFFSTS